MADAADFSAALRYGPQTTQALQRSRYLSDALKAMSEGSQNIRSGGELAAKLLAAAILRRGDIGARKDLATAAQADRQSEIQSLLAGLGGNPLTPKPALPPMPSTTAPSDAGGISASMPVPTSAVEGLPSAAPMPSMPAISRPSGSVGDMTTALSNLIGKIKVTSGYRSPEHNAEVGGVPNSYHTRGMGEAIDFIPPPGVGFQQLAQTIAKAGLPRKELLNEGDHIHWAWGDAGGAGPMPAPPQGPAPQPLQAAAPPAPAPSPVTGAFVPPSGGPAPGASPQAAPGVTYNAPSADEIARARALMSDPRTFEVGRAYAIKLQERALTPQKWDTATVNGIPVQVDPNTGALRPLSLPEQAKTTLMPAQQAGIGTAPQGLYVQRDPLGNLKEAPGAPPQGFNAGPGGYAPIRGGPADPTRVQPPPQNYQLVGPNRYEAIPGGAADPKSSANLVQNEMQLRKEYDPSLKEYAAARTGYEKVLSAARDNTGASDIALIFGFMKTLDPTSTVREGEFATAQNSGSVDQSLMNLYNKALKGERLQPEQRQQFAKTAASQFGVAQQRFDQTNQRFSALAQTYGFDPTHIIQTFDTPTPSALPAPTGGGSGAGLRALPPAQQATVMRFKGAQGRAGTAENPLIAHSPQEAMKFPPGTVFISPDGQIRKVPNP